MDMESVEYWKKQFVLDIELGSDSHSGRKNDISVVPQASDV